MNDVSRDVYSGISMTISVLRVSASTVIAVIRGVDVGLSVSVHAA